MKNKLTDESTFRKILLKELLVFNDKIYSMNGFAGLPLLQDYWYDSVGKALRNPMLGEQSCRDISFVKLPKLLPHLILLCECTCINTHLNCAVTPSVSSSFTPEISPKICR